MVKYCSVYPYKRILLPLKTYETPCKAWILCSYQWLYVVVKHITQDKRAQRMILLKIILRTCVFHLVKKNKNDEPDTVRIRIILTDGQYDSSSDRTRSNLSSPSSLISLTFYVYITICTCHPSYTKYLN